MTTLIEIVNQAVSAGRSVTLEVEGTSRNFYATNCGILVERPIVEGSAQPAAAFQALLEVAGTGLPAWPRHGSPAAELCRQQGGRVKIANYANGDELAVCRFSDASSVEAAGLLHFAVKHPENHEAVP